MQLGAARFMKAALLIVGGFFEIVGLLATLVAWVFLRQSDSKGD
jgi:hypothetical protein